MLNGAAFRDAETGRTDDAFVGAKYAQSLSKGFECGFAGRNMNSNAASTPARFLDWHTVVADAASHFP